MNQVIQCLIIDDEPNNILLLKEMLRKHFRFVVILDTSNSAQKGIELIKELKPDLVFLDIEMPELNGFEVLKELEPLSFEVIFVTAFTDYALKAYEHNAIGYITKPINLEKLTNTLKNAYERILHKSSAENLFSIIESRIQSIEEDKIPLSTMNGILFVKRSEIIYCESSSNYTCFYLTNGKKVIVSRNLGDYEKLFMNSNFVRIHDRYLIHLEYVTEYIKGRGGEVVLGKITLPVSETRKDFFLSRFEKWLKR